jgi:hypothetical protein
MWSDWSGLGFVFGLDDRYGFEIFGLEDLSAVETFDIIHAIAPGDELGSLVFAEGLHKIQRSGIRIILMAGKTVSRVRGPVL